MDTDKANEQRNLVDNPAADRLRDYITVHGNGKANRDAMHGMLDEALATARQQGREEAVKALWFLNPVQQLKARDVLDRLAGDGGDRS